VIDNASQEFSPGVLEWLRADLAKHRKGTNGIELVFVAMHIPPAIPGLNVHVEGSKAEKFQTGSAELLALLREYSVDAVFAGHIHTARTIELEGGPRLVISGAAGAPQGWLKKVYGYHRVAVNDGKLRAAFIEVTPGEQRSQTMNVARRSQACPRIAGAY
jgi:Icc-related predicted phosphoesterase